MTEERKITEILNEVDDLNNLKHRLLDPVFKKYNKTESLDEFKDCIDSLIEELITKFGHISYKQHRENRLKENI